MVRVKMENIAWDEIIADLQCHIKNFNSYSVTSWETLEAFEMSKDMIRAVLLDGNCSNVKVSLEAESVWIS